MCSKSAAWKHEARKWSGKAAPVSRSRWKVEKIYFASTFLASMKKNNLWDNQLFVSHHQPVYSKLSYTKIFSHLPFLFAVFYSLVNTIPYMLTGHSCARWITPLFKTVITIVQVHMYLSTRRRHKPKISWLPSSPTLTKATGGSELLMKTFWCQAWANFFLSGLAALVTGTWQGVSKCQHLGRRCSRCIFSVHPLVTWKKSERNSIFWKFYIFIESQSTSSEQWL